MIQKLRLFQTNDVRSTNYPDITVVSKSAAKISCLHNGMDVTYKRKTITDFRYQIYYRILKRCDRLHRYATTENGDYWDSKILQIHLNENLLINVLYDTSSYSKRFFYLIFKIRRRLALRSRPVTPPRSTGYKFSVTFITKFFTDKLVY